MEKGNYLVLLLTLIFTSSASALTDSFSRANCFNNEALSYDYFDPPQWRFVSSHHYKNGVLKHYVTENPPRSCVPAFSNVRTVSGLHCTYKLSYKRRHAAVHGAFLSSEPNPDGNLFPGVTSEWRTVGYHGHYYPAFNGYIRIVTRASNCNLRFNQFY